MRFDVGGHVVATHDPCTRYARSPQRRLERDDVLRCRPRCDERVEVVDGSQPGLAVCERLVEGDRITDHGSERRPLGIVLDRDGNPAVVEARVAAVGRHVGAPVPPGGHVAVELQLEQTVGHVPRRGFDLCRLDEASAQAAIASHERTDETHERLLARRVVRVRQGASDGIRVVRVRPQPRLPREGDEVGAEGLVLAVRPATEALGRQGHDVLALEASLLVRQPPALDDRRSHVLDDHVAVGHQPLHQVGALEGGHVDRQTPHAEVELVERGDVVDVVGEWSAPEEVDVDLGLEPEDVGAEQREQRAGFGDDGTGAELQDPHPGEGQGRVDVGVDRRRARRFEQDVGQRSATIVERWGRRDRGQRRGGLGDERWPNHRHLPVFGVGDGSEDPPLDDVRVGPEGVRCLQRRDRHPEGLALGEQVLHRHAARVTRQHVGERVEVLAAEHPVGPRARGQLVG